MRRKKSIWKRLKYKNIAVALACVLLITVSIHSACSKSDDNEEKKDPTPQSSQNDDKQTSTTTTKKEDTKTPEVVYSTENLEDDYKYIVMNNDSDLYKGDLILINGDYSYQGDDLNDLVSCYDYRTNKENVKIMSLKDSSVSAKKEVLENLNAMLSDFYTATGLSDIMLVSGYRSVEYQQELYDADLAKTGKDFSTTVEKPNHSEHHSGYAIDFQLDQEGYPFFNGQGDYKWIYENCYKYGFILRYDADKSSITGIDGEGWHFRYVGVPHAQLIYYSKLCYEEYVLSIKQYSRENPLYVNVLENGDRYAIYYVAADKNSDTTNVDIPKYNDGSEYHYTVSGNNCDGYIVTVNISAGKVKSSD